jgi:uncharacterized protein (DUF1778 family)
MSAPVRSEILRVRLLPAERALVERAAELEQCSLADFLRSVIVRAAFRRARSGPPAHLVDSR